MKMRALRSQAPRNLGRRATDRAIPPRGEAAPPWPAEVPAGPGRRRAPLASDATIEPAPGPGPEAVFDRVTGPYASGARRGLDEGT
jgi:hypothetical protein